MAPSNPIELRHDGAASIVVLTAPPLNLLDPETIDALVAAHQAADDHPETRVIVSRSGLPGVFSQGLDPAAVLAADLAGRKRFFDAVGRMIHGLYALKKPHLAVVNGPAMAAGAVWAITADWRCFDHIRGRISFSETKVGLPVPEALIAIIRQACSGPHLRDVVLLGKNCDAETALAAGLADAAAHETDIPGLVAKHVERLARLSPAVAQATKAALRAPVLAQTAALADGMPPTFERYLSDAFLGEGLRALIANRHPAFRG